MVYFSPKSVRGWPNEYIWALEEFDRGLIIPPFDDSPAPPAREIGEELKEEEETRGERDDEEEDKSFPFFPFGDLGEVELVTKPDPDTDVEK